MDEQKIYWVFVNMGEYRDEYNFSNLQDAANFIRKYKKEHECNNDDIQLFEGKRLTVRFII